MRIEIPDDLTQELSRCATWRRVEPDQLVREAIKDHLAQMEPLEAECAAWEAMRDEALLLVEGRMNYGEISGASPVQGRA